MRLNLTIMSMKNLLYTAVCGYMGALSFGYMIGYSSPSLPQMQEKGEIMHSDQAAAAWFGSLATLGAMLGCPIGGWLVEKVGRKMTLVITASPFLVGWFSIYMGSNLMVLYAGRFLTGIGSGMVCVASPLYIAETSTKELRGMLGSGVQLSVTLGILLVYMLGTLMDWRHLAVVGCIMPLMSLLMIARARDSPRYLLNVGQRPEAVRSLLWLRGNLAAAEEECRDMEENSDIEEKSENMWIELRRPELYRPLVVSLFVNIFQQTSGINVVMFYTVEIFQLAGFDVETSGKATVIIGIVQVIGTVLACFLMDRSGRKKLLVFGGIGMGLTCLSLGAVYLQMHSGSSSSNVAATTNTLAGINIGWFSVASLVGYVFLFAIGWGPIPMLLMSEIFPSRSRGIASGIVSLANWFCAFAITNQFTTLTAALGLHGAFFVFSISCFISAVFVVRCVPETKGKSLEDIELYFLGQTLRGYHA